MDFGVVLQTNPPASRVVEMMRRAEDAGFSYGWTWDSHVLWQEPFVIYSAVLAETSTMTIGPMVTNPGTRDWSVTASLFATLNDMFGNRIRTSATAAASGSPAGAWAAQHLGPAQGQGRPPGTHRPEGQPLGAEGHGQPFAGDLHFPRQVACELLHVSILHVRIVVNLRFPSAPRAGAGAVPRKTTTPRRSAGRPG